MQKYSGHNKTAAFWFFFVLISTLFLFFPSHNNSGDAWSYAADAKFGNELFSPHHLLYTVSLFLLRFVTSAGDTLAIGMVFNAVFAVLSIVVLAAILKKITGNPLQALALSAMAAFSFGFWRFATENENYIIPIFYSLLGSYFFIRSCITKDFRPLNIILSGIFATIACLYHQVHIFWFAGLLYGWALADGRFSLKRAALFAMMFVIAPIAYFLVIAFYLHQSLSFYHIAHFVFHDYYTGGAGNRVGINNLVLGGINFFRTFFQVHGQVSVMVAKNAFWLLPGIIGVLLWGFGIRWMLTREKNRALPGTVHNHAIIFKTHLLVFILQLAFAVYNVGNAEFMVMLPALLAIMAAHVNWVPVKSIALAALSLLIWNFAYGIYPNCSLHFNADDKVSQFVISHPKDIFIAAEPALVSNEVYYQAGHWPENVWPAPGYYLLHGPLNELRSKTDSALARGNVFTDCTGRPEITSRASILYSKSNSFFGAYKLSETVASFATYAGPHRIFKLGR